MYLDLGDISATVKAIFYNKSFIDSTSAIPEDSFFGVILDRTSFYAEAGGQEYDTGNIVIDGVADFEVTNVQVYNGYVVHTGRLKYGQLQVGNTVVSSYDEVHCHHLYCNSLPEQLNNSYVDGLSGTITRLLIFSTSVCARPLAIILTKRAPWLLRRNYALTLDRKSVV